MKNLITLLFFMLFTFWVNNSYSGVNLKNGNFFIAYTDVVSTSKGITLKITRTYNSKSTNVGWFGYGWGTPFEVKLEPSVDGSVIIHENGTGGKTRFTPGKKVSSKAVTDSVSKIIAVMKKQNSLAGKAEKDLREKLESDNFLRHKMAKAYGVSSNIPVGTKMTSHTFGYQTVEVVKQGYKRSYESGLVQYFSKSGYLIASAEKNGYKIQLKRNKKTKQVEKILDSAGNQIYLTWDSNNRLKSASVKGGKKALYKYSGKNLTASTDINGLSYSYAYDGSHNLTKITDERVKNPKLASIEVKYAPKTFFATEVKKRNGETSRYIYESNPKNHDLHYWTIVVKQGLNNETYANKYEYEHKRRSDGSQWLYRTNFVTGADYKNKKVSGGVARETINNECCEQPLRITQGSRITDFAYNNDGFMTSKKSNDGSFVKLQYNSKYQKVSKITDNDGWTSYEYNKKGELKKAVSSNGRAVLLVYDIGGRISKMVDQVKNKKRVLGFKYNAQGKPIEVAMDKVGKISIQYDNYGQVKKVDSKGNRSIASQVSETFQNLISIVRPAGVNLSL